MAMHMRGLSKDSELIKKGRKPHVTVYHESSGKDMHLRGFYIVDWKFDSAAIETVDA